MAELRSILSDPQFPVLVERLDASAWLEAANKAPPARHLEVRTVDGARLVLDTSPEQPVSRAFLLGIDRPLSRGFLQQIIGTYAEAGIDSFSTQLLPIARPTHAPRLLVAAGFRRGPQQVVVVRPTRGVEPEDPFFRIVIASPVDMQTIHDVMVLCGDISDWATLISGMVTSDHWRFHIAYEGSLPYAISGFYLNGEYALQFRRMWIMPGYETRGVETALVQSTIRDAERQGCSWIGSIFPVTAETRTRRFQRLGFEVAFRRQIYHYGQEPERNGIADPLSKGYFH